jgi:hypothetical protein
MEDIMNLVAATFVRHGIESPAQDNPTAVAAIPAEPSPTTKLPEHNYRKPLQTEPAAT